MTATVGIDLASRAAGTAVCGIEWGPEPRVSALMRGVVTDSQTPLDDKALLSILRCGYGAMPEDVTKIAIDAPFGWPSAFVDALSSGAGWPSFNEGVHPEMTRRRTDHWVADLTGKSPLSVSTDRIAYPAMRLAGLFEALGETEVEAVIDRTGRTGRFCEAYPDPAIRMLGLWPAGAKPRASYKRSGGVEIRRAILDRLQARAPWLAISSDQVGLCVETDDALDALICALVARAAERRDLVHSIPAAAEGDARREGWINLPRDGALEHLR